MFVILTSFLSCSVLEVSLSIMSFIALTRPNMARLDDGALCLQMMMGPAGFIYPSLAMFGPITLLVSCDSGALKFERCCH